MGGPPSLPQPTLSPKDWERPTTATGCPGNSRSRGQVARPTSPPAVCGPSFLFTTARFFLSGTHPLAALDPNPLQTQGKLSGPASFPSFFPPSFPLPPHKPRGKVTKEPQGMALPLMKNEYVKVELGMGGKKRTDNKRDCQVQGGDRV